MAQKAIELILARQLASCLAMPIFIVDRTGILVFYNEPAEKILGLRFDETGELGPAEWATKFEPTDDAGMALAPEAIPLYVALAEHQPAHGTFWIQGLDGQRRYIAVTAFPIIGQAERQHGAIAIFWETAS